MPGAMIDTYQEAIAWIVETSVMSQPLLHVHIGMALFLATRLISRQRLDTMTPLAVVIVAELLNELLDRAHFGAWRWRDTASDVFHTLLWPVLLSYGAL